MKSDLVIKQRKLEFIVCAFIALLCSVFLYQTFSFPQGIESTDVGPAAFPRLVFSAVLILDLVYFIQVVTSKGDKMITLKNWWLVMAMLVSYGVYIWLNGAIGYFPATVIYLVGALLIMRNTKWKFNVFFIIGLLLILYFGFYQIVGVQLPKGALLPRLCAIF